VQLANFKRPSPSPVESTWAELREAQAVTAEEVPQAGIVTAIDIGDAVDVHPTNKQEVGRRLALAAENISYGKDIVYAGPEFAGIKIDGSKVTITFKNIGKGLTVKGGEPLKGFAIAGKDKKFVWADAELKNDEVAVSSPKVKNPVAVRYAWADNPDKANLFNKDGFPAFPFRTDNWKGITFGKK
jgi:sialate O-acetylesterase